MNPFACSDFHHAMTRRHALKVGGLGLLGLAMPQLLRAEALAGIDQIVMGQVAVRAFSELFFAVGVAFIVTLPILILLGKGGNKQAAAEAH